MGLMKRKREGEMVQCFVAVVVGVAQMLAKKRTYNYVVAVAAMEFSKPSKPRVWYTRPWSPSASVKPLSHSGCRENRTNKHSYHLKVNFAELGSNTLGQYSTFELAGIAVA
uniref:Putative histone deacetylase complex subunit SAP30/SAP30-like protein n=1 Tax=Helianthus annuus TaxID=4232 RepID=A0A251VKY6_HELAN